MRNDSVLNTGMSSAVERKLAARRTEELKRRQGHRAELTPGAEIILEWINKEIDDTKNLEKMILNISSEENVRAQILAKQYHLEFLKSMRNRVRNTLRSAKAADAAAAKEADKDAPEAWKQEAES